MTDSEPELDPADRLERPKGLLSPPSSRRTSGLTSGRTIAQHVQVGTWPAEDLRGVVDSGREWSPSLSEHKEGHRPRPSGVNSSFLFVTAVLAILGAGIGWAIESLLPPVYEASSTIDLLPDSSVVVGSGPSPDQSDRFIQGELVYINSPPFAQMLAASERNAGGGLAISATQIGKTNVIEIVVDSRSRQGSEAGVAAAATAYLQHRRTALSVRLKAVADKAADIATQMRGLAPGNVAIPPLQAEYQRLLSEGNDLLVGEQAADRQSTAVHSLSGVEARDTRSPTRGAVLGALVGIVVALGFLVRRRRWSAGPAPAEPEGGR